MKKRKKTLSQQQKLKEEAKLETTSVERLKQIASESNTLARIVAKNPVTPPELLAELCCINNISIQKAVVSNPNTPKKTLLTLGSKFPKQLLANPVFEIFYLENVNFVNEILLDTLFNLFKQKNIPQFLLKWAAKHYDTEISEAAQMHVNLSGEMTEAWQEAAEKTIEFVEKKNLWQEFDFSNFPELIPFDVIALSQYIGLRQIVAKSPKTPVNLLEQLAKHKNSDIREKLAYNPNTPLKILEKLAKDRDPIVRTKLVQNSNTPVNIIEKLSLDKDINVRVNVALNKKIPVNIIEQLCNDSDEVVRYLAIKNNKTSVNLLEQLANDKNIMVRRGVAANINTPISILEKLAEDENVEVRHEAAENRNTPQEIAIKTLTKVINELRQSNTALHREIRQTIAENLNTPIILFEKLANDSDLYVRLRIAKNSNTPINVLKNLAATDNDKEVLMEILKNPKCSLNLKRIIFDRLAKSRKPSLVRLTVFLNNYANSKLLARNCHSTSWLERYAIAQNVQTPNNTLKFLAKDANRIVRAAAKANLESR